MDLQSNLKAQQSAAYARKVTLSNLREAAKTLCYIQEHGYDSREELESAFEASNHELTATRTALRESDDRIKALNEQIHYIGQYHSNKAVHSDFLNAKDKKSFREKHSAELDLYNAARTFLKKSFPDKVPTISKLRAERDALIQEKKEKTNRYDAAKAAQKDLFTARTNVARILDEPLKKGEPNMKKARKLYTSFEQLPLTLNADDIAAYLNISRGNAYTLLHREDFPTLRIGKRMIAPRDKFLVWLDQQMSA